MERNVAEEWFDELKEVKQRRAYHRKRTKSSFARFNNQAFDYDDDPLLDIHELEGLQFVEYWK
jgi:hypothetical protein